MAITNHGVNVLLNSSFIPDGYSISPVAPFDPAGKATYDLNIRIPRDNVKDNDREVTFSNLIAALATAAKEVMEDEFDTSKDVEIYTDFMDVDTNVIKGKSNDFYTDAPTFFVCRSRIYVKVE